MGKLGQYKRRKAFWIAAAHDRIDSQRDRVNRHEVRIEALEALARPIARQDGVAVVDYRRPAMARWVPVEVGQVRGGTVEEGFVRVVEQQAPDSNVFGIVRSHGEPLRWLNTPLWVTEAYILATWPFVATATDIPEELKVRKVEAAHDVEVGQGVGDRRRPLVVDREYLLELVLGSVMRVIFKRMRAGEAMVRDASASGSRAQDLIPVAPSRLMERFAFYAEDERKIGQSHFVHTAFGDVHLRERRRYSSAIAVVTGLSPDEKDVELLSDNGIRWTWTAENVARLRLIADGEPDEAEPDTLFGTVVSSKTPVEARPGQYRANDRGQTVRLTEMPGHADRFKVVVVKGAAERPSWCTREYVEKHWPIAIPDVQVPEELKTPGERAGCKPSPNNSGHCDAHDSILPTDDPTGVCAAASSFQPFYSARRGIEEDLGLKEGTADSKAFPWGALYACGYVPRPRRVPSPKEVLDVRTALVSGPMTFDALMKTTNLGREKLEAALKSHGRNIARVPGTALEVYSWTYADDPVPAASAAEKFASDITEELGKFLGEVPDSESALDVLKRITAELRERRSTIINVFACRDCGHIIVAINERVAGEHRCKGRLIQILTIQNGEEHISVRGWWHPNVPADGEMGFRAERRTKDGALITQAMESLGQPFSQTSGQWVGRGPAPVSPEATPKQFGWVHQYVEDARALSEGSKPPEAIYVLAGYVKELAAEVYEAVDVIQRLRADRADRQTLPEHDVALSQCRTNVQGSAIRIIDRPSGIAWEVSRLWEQTRWTTLTAAEIMALYPIVLHGGISPEVIHKDLLDQLEDYRATIAKISEDQHDDSNAFARAYAYDAIERAVARAEAHGTSPTPVSPEAIPTPAFPFTAPSSVSVSKAEAIPCPTPTAKRAPGTVAGTVRNLVRSKLVLSRHMHVTVGALVRVTGLNASLVEGALHDLAHEIERTGDTYRLVQPAAPAAPPAPVPPAPPAIPTFPPGTLRGPSVPLAHVPGFEDTEIRLLSETFATEIKRAKEGRAFARTSGNADHEAMAKGELKAWKAARDLFERARALSLVHEPRYREALSAWTEVDGNVLDVEEIIRLVPCPECHAHLDMECVMRAAEPKRGAASPAEGAHVERGQTRANDAGEVIRVSALSCSEPPVYELVPIAGLTEAPRRTATDIASRWPIVLKGNLVSVDEMTAADQQAELRRRSRPSMAVAAKQCRANDAGDVIRVDAVHGIGAARVCELSGIVGKAPPSTWGLGTVDREWPIVIAGPVERVKPPAPDRLLNLGARPAPAPAQEEEAPKAVAREDLFRKLDEDADATNGASSSTPNAVGDEDATKA